MPSGADDDDDPVIKNKKIPDNNSACPVVGLDCVSSA